jgi:F0F1-type ATP synthase membrane subunit c/vacuolar-type H+-ATPase subunit K
VQEPPEPEQARKFSSCLIFLAVIGALVAVGLAVGLLVLYVKIKRGDFAE